MTGVLVRRLVFLVPTALLVSVMVFSLVLLIPGDAARTIAGPTAPDEVVQQVRAELQLDEPLAVQYWHWLTGAVRGEFGDSLITGQNVRDSMVERLPTTLSLAAGAMLVTVAVGVGAGLLCAAFEGGWIDRILRAGSALPIAFPNYFVGMLLALVFGVWNEWLPASQYVRPSEDLGSWVQHLVLPSLALGLAGAAVVTRQLRTSLTRILEQDYVRSARAKGLSGRSVLLKHALKNAAVPVVTILIGQVSLLVGGTVIVEQVFGIQGLGQMAVAAVVQRDLPVIQGVVVFTTVIVLLSNLSADLVYRWLNPRIRLE